MSTAILVWGVLFSAFGLGFFVYGRRQNMIVPLVTGVALMIYPYFVDNTYVLVGVGILLMGVPYFLRY